MFLRIVICFVISLFSYNSYCQLEFEGTEILTVELGASINRVKNIKSDWNINLKSFEASPNKSSIPDAELEAKKRNNKLISPTNIGDRSAALDPVMNINFEGNRGTGSVPPDNTIAVSTNGYIITSINSNLIFTSSTGRTLESISLGDFFTDLRLSGTFFDPKVLFDHEEKRFVIVSLSGSTSTTSHIAIAFSETEDPMGKWNLYAIKGDVIDEDVWFDYPNIGINNEDLYITGNMFTDENSYRYSTVLQIDKDKGYSGEAIAFKAYTKMKAKNTNQNLFNITPCPKGWNYNLDQNMYFLTNDNRGGNAILLCQITKKLEDNPSFLVGDLASVNEYDTSPNAPQKNNGDPLRTGDCRIMYGIELNGIIHYVFNSGANGLAGITYGRYNLSNNQVRSAFYSEPEMYLGYPAISAFGETESESKVLINFVRSNEVTYAETAAVVCEGQNNTFNWSNSILIREGLGQVTALDGEFERWGDYSASFRRFWNNKIEVWTLGCIGRSSFGSWTAQIFDKDTNGDRTSFNDFTVDNSIINVGDTVTLSYFGDTIVGNSLTWDFPGATFISNDSISLTLRFDSLGFYDVSLVGVDVRSNDTFDLFKNKYISVVPEVFVPVTDFIADKVNGYKGDTISFTDLSINEPETWRWSFTSGTPDSSMEQNPKVIYNKTGQHSVVLVAKNSAGDNVKIKQKYITITEKPVLPVADFIADKTEITVGDSITFLSNSLNNPTSLFWVFTGADVDTSSSITPFAKYSNEGSYNVMLIASNEAGSDTITKENYITVGPSSLEKVDWLSTNVLYPNPVINETFSLEFHLSNSAYLTIKLIDNNGKMIKLLVEKSAKAGKNLFTFNANMLNNGYYILQIEDKHTKKFKNIPFVINK